jgi:hypothetical protein
VEPPPRTCAWRDHSPFLRSAPSVKARPPGVEKRRAVSVRYWPTGAEGVDPLSKSGGGGGDGFWPGAVARARRTVRRGSLVATAISRWLSPAAARRSTAATVSASRRRGRPIGRPEWLPWMRTRSRAVACPRAKDDHVVRLHADDGTSRTRGAVTPAATLGVHRRRALRGPSSPARFVSGQELQDA